MAFFRYGFTFLAGTGFGAAMSSLRQDGCLRHRHCCHGRGGGRLDREEPETWATEKDQEKYARTQDMKRGIKCPKEGNKEKRAAASKGVESD
ncbi:hypothetical protein BRADI_3g16655v3 [Brachypodium distachyon]|uniref:Uncharacterized protein n=1 Tax=Brachypodium distachyon TaxID=15368 RepID=A0A0Q3Q127_BRADI|nr:hypothetical protein BRADI_3g16655v3 [Brachypodium distachyon]